MIRPLMEQMAIVYATQIEEQQAEIERLRKALERTRPHVRNEIIEECARVIEQWEHAEEPLSYRDLIDRVRALKYKPKAS